MPYRRAGTRPWGRGVRPSRRPVCWVLGCLFVARFFGRDRGSGCVHELTKGCNVVLYVASTEYRAAPLEETVIFTVAVGTSR